MKPNTIKIDDQEYVRADLASVPESGTRRIVVLDRGWIFAGNINDAGDLLTNVVNVRRWEEGGFGGLTLDPVKSKAQLDPCKDLELRPGIFMVRVADNWGVE